jgi:hypothetical protein
MVRLNPVTTQQGKEANKVVLQPGEIDDEGTLVVDSTETGRVKVGGI